MIKNQTNPLIKKLNYKDILIILGLWYFMAAFNFLTGEFSFNYTPILTGLFHYLFILTGRFIYLALILFYLTSFYPITFSDLGLNFTNLKKQLIPGFSLVFGLSLAVLFFINIPLSYSISNPKFAPLYQANDPQIFMNSLLPLLTIFISNIIITLSEQILLNDIIFELFAIKFNHFLAMILSSLFYSILLLTFSPSQIVMNFIIAFISIYLYTKAGSLLSSTIFMAGYYSIYILYIYGWEFLVF